MLCPDTFGSNEAEVVCNQLGYVNDGRGKLLFITGFIMTSFVVEILWYTVSSPRALPKDSLNVKVDLSCTGNETGITDCIDSQPNFVKNSHCVFIKVICPGMIASVVNVI